MQDTPVVGQESLFIATPRVPNTSKRRLLTAIDELIDLSDAREAAAPYFSDIGRPAIPVERMIKAMLIGCLFGIASDRRLAEECADSAAFREFLGLGWNEQMFSHASFTNWRQRLGPEFFRRFLHDIVGQCEAHGMQLGQARMVDATTIKAQASLDGPQDDLPRDLDTDGYVTDVFAGDEPEPPNAQDTRRVNRHDPDAHLQRKGKQPADFGFQGSFSSDPDSGLIVDATATGTERPSTAVDHVDHDPGTVTELAADARYEDATMIQQLHDRGVTTYVPRVQRDKPGQFGKDRFVYDADNDRYECPNGCFLTFLRDDPAKRRRRYAANPKDCANCPYKADCTPGKRRTLGRHYAETARELAVREGPRYEQLQRQRRTSEHLFMLGKRDHGLRRARSLGLAAVRIQVALTAVAINLKKLLRFTEDNAPACLEVDFRKAARAVCAPFRALLQVAGWACRRQWAPPGPKDAAHGRQDHAGLILARRATTDRHPATSGVS